MEALLVFSMWMVALLIPALIVKSTILISISVPCTITITLLPLQCSVTTITTTIANTTTVQSTMMCTCTSYEDDTDDSGDCDSTNDDDAVHRLMTTTASTTTTATTTTATATAIATTKTMMPQAPIFLIWKKGERGGRGVRHRMKQQTARHTPYRWGIVIDPPSPPPYHYSWLLRLFVLDDTRFHSSVKSWSPH